MPGAPASTSPGSLRGVSTDVTRRPTTAVRVGVWTGSEVRDRPDKIVTEEPMEIRLIGPSGTAEPLAVVMRTPGHDFELAVGFAITEGVIETGADIAEVRYCLGPDAQQEYNVVTLATRHPVDLAGHQRSFVSGASCGVCGKQTLEELAVRCDPLGAGPSIPMSVVLELPTTLRTAQSVFDATGGLHAAGLFSAEGVLGVVREDVGRHNAVDKIVGHLALNGGLPAATSGLVVSGRVSFEIVQKAARAGITVLIAVSAPSSLAVATAERFGMTLVAFVRDGQANVYTGAHRIVAR
ncbi:MAG: formate dehydrogenase accessory sulfurtransferase FdhD [Acidimicrobiia bacterium]|nr:formate dehydrogenase accessory sulfurtransferase FdhD [Acidimicrobiia bacterium]